MMQKKSSTATAKVDPAAQPEEGTTYILLSGKHSRRLPDGTSERFYPGDEIPNPSAQELAFFGDKIVTAETFTALASAHEQVKKSEAARKMAMTNAKALNPQVVTKDRDPDAVKRAEVLQEIRAEETRKSRIHL